MTADTFFTALWRLAKPHRWALVLGSCFMLVETAASLCVPWLAGRFAEDFLGGDRPSLRIILWALAGLLTVQAVLRIAGSFIFTRRASIMLADLRMRLYEHVQSLPLAFFQQRQQGAILSILSNDVAMVNYYLSATLVGVLPMLVSIVGSVFILLSIDLRLGFVVGLGIPVFFLLLKVFGRKIRPLSSELQEAYAQAFALEEENLSMLPAIKTFTREPVETQRYRVRVENIVRIALKHGWIESTLGPGLQWIMAMAVIAILLLAGDQLLGNQLGTGSLVSFLMYTALLTGPVGALAGLYGQTQHARASMQRLRDVFDASPERDDAAAPSLQVTGGRIEFVDIGFAYGDRQPVLTGFNLTIGAKETVAITGENGTGKSTLVSLLARLTEPQYGRILIDGVDISSVNLRSLRQSIAVVPQHVFLFNGTVRENIAYGLVGADDVAIERASELAQAHVFIRALPQGYDTMVGDQGVRLSGGQRQRIALARALLKNPAILILDEATAMFDPEAEQHFLRDCRETLRLRTVLLITHRPASLALADRVVHLTAVPDGQSPRPQVRVTSQAVGYA